MKPVVLALAHLLLAVTAFGQLATKGRLLLAEDFRADRTYTKEYQSLQDGWRVRAWHQQWRRTTDGIESVWTSGHMPVLALEGAFRNVIVEVEFRFRKAPAQKAVFRVSALNPELDPRAYAVSTWANADSKERPLGVSLERDQWSPLTYTTVAREAAEFATDTWYPLRLEVLEDQALVACNGVTLVGRHEKFALPKTVLALGTGHCPHELRRLRVYEALPTPGRAPPPAGPSHSDRR